MINQEILDYIKTQTSAGKSREEITSALIAGGWRKEDVEQAFNSIASGVPAPIMQAMPSASDIFQEAWEIYKHHYRTLIAITIIPAAIVIVLALLTAGGALVASAIKTDLHKFGPVGIVLAVVFGLVFIYLILWAQVAQLIAIRDHSENIGYKEAFKRARSRILGYFGTSLLTGLVVIAGFILLIIPGFIFGFWFSQSIYVFIGEGLTGASALKRSKYYVKGRVGQIFTKGFYMAAITLGLYIVIWVIISGLKYLLGDYFNWLSNLFSIVWGPMATIYAYLIYKHLKATRP